MGKILILFSQKMIKEWYPENEIAKALKDGKARITGGIFVKTEANFMPTDRFIHKK
jgi:hypothetical protein